MNIGDKVRISGRFIPESTLEKIDEYGIEKLRKDMPYLIEFPQNDFVGKIVHIDNVNKRCVIQFDNTIRPQWVSFEDL